MARTTKVVRNRIYIEDRVYDASVLGGGRFDVLNAAGVRIGSFQVKGRAVEAEDLGIEGADPVHLIGTLWVRENLSPLPEAQPAIAVPPIATGQPAPAPAPPPAVAPPAPLPAPPPSPASSPNAVPAQEKVAVVDPALRPVCRLATHGVPDVPALQRALVYQAWLRTQAGVTTAVLVREPKSGKVFSIAVWDDREKFGAMRYAKPPAGAAPLPSLSVELCEVIG
jgi:2-oxoglutarate dehydrogenase E2 component (dihydrolipoamide succinyltransferase)